MKVSDLERENKNISTTQKYLLPGMTTTIAMLTVAMRTACSLHFARINAEILNYWYTKY